MNRNILCGLLLVLSVGTAFAAPKKKKKVVKAKSKITSIEIKRGACFGRCPEYTLILSADGSAIYSGRRNATYQGVYVKKFDAAKVQDLFREFDRYRADTCAQRYETIPDMAGLNYEISYNGDDKIIQNANSPFAPKFLKGLAIEMDQLAPIDKTWKKTENWVDPNKAQK